MRQCPPSGERTNRSVFPNSRITDVARYGDVGPRPAGTVMTVEFELDGQKFVALNGGADFTFSEAISFQVSCETQEEVDAFWSTLSEGGEEGPCGWLKDKFGLSWQIVPTALPRLLRDEEDRDRRSRAGRRAGVGTARRQGRRRAGTGAAGRGRSLSRPGSGRPGRSARGRTRSRAGRCRSRTSPFPAPASARRPRRRAPSLAPRRR